MHVSEHLKFQLWKKWQKLSAHLYQTQSYIWLKYPQQWIAGSLSSINDISFSPSSVTEEFPIQHFFYLSKAELDMY